MVKKWKLMSLAPIYRGCLRGEHAEEAGLQEWRIWKESLKVASQQPTVAFTNPASLSFEIALGQNHWSNIFWYIPNPPTYIHIPVIDGATRINFSYHPMPRPRFKPRTVEFPWPGTFLRTLYELSYQANATLNKSSVLRNKLGIRIWDLNSELAWFHDTKN